jgi:hypothetical protein
MLTRCLSRFVLVATVATTITSGDIREASTANAFLMTTSSPSNRNVGRSNPRSSIVSASLNSSTNAGTSSSATERKSNGASHLSLGGDLLRQLVVNADRQDMATTFLDVKGILWLEHVNLVVSSKYQAEYFYVHFLGCTRDAGSSFHVNMGQQQFHLAEAIKGATEQETTTPQRIAGSIGLVVPSLETLRARIPDAVQQLQGTQFVILEDKNNVVSLKCPDGNLFHVYSVNDQVETTAKLPATTTSSSSSSSRKMEQFHAEGGLYGPQRMAIRGNPGIKYLELACPMGTIPAIAQFYQELLQCTTVVQQQQVASDTTTAATCSVCVGPGVHLVFVEKENISLADTQAMQGVHLCVYTQDFYGLYQRLSQRNLFWTNPRFVHLDTCDTWEDAMACRTLRFKDIIDLTRTGDDNKILELEHETRPLRHGQYLKVPKYEPK